MIAVTIREIATVNLLTIRKKVWELLTLVCLPYSRGTFSVQRCIRCISWVTFHCNVFGWVDAVSEIILLLPLKLSLLSLASSLSESSRNSLRRNSHTKLKIFLNVSSAAMHCIFTSIATATFLFVLDSFEVYYLEQAQLRSSQCFSQYPNFLGTGNLNGMRPSPSRSFIS